MCCCCNNHFYLVTDVAPNGRWDRVGSVLESEQEADVDGLEVKVAEDARLQVDREETVAHRGNDERQKAVEIKESFCCCIPNLVEIWWRFTWTRWSESWGCCKWWPSWSFDRRWSWFLGDLHARRYLCWTIMAWNLVRLNFQKSKKFTFYHSKFFRGLYFT